MSGQRAIKSEGERDENERERSRGTRSVQVKRGDREEEERINPRLTKMENGKIEKTP